MKAQINVINIFLLIYVILSVVIALKMKMTSHSEASKFALSPEVGTILEYDFE